MSDVKVRFYLWLDSGPVRYGLDNKKAYPQFAGQRVRRVECTYWFTGDVLNYNAIGAFYDFDEAGHRDINLRAAMEATHAHSTVAKESRVAVPRLDVIREADKVRKDYTATHKWQLSEDDYALIAADLLDEKRIPMLRQQKP